MMFLTVGPVSSAEIQEQLSALFKDNYLSWSHLSEWHVNFWEDQKCLLGWSSWYWYHWCRHWPHWDNTSHMQQRTITTSGTSKSTSTPSLESRYGSWWCSMFMLPKKVDGNPEVWIRQGDETACSSFSASGFENLHVGGLRKLTQ
jgi:hypothetical protein